MLSALDKEQYWRTVEASLVEILGIDAAEAYQKVLELRLNIAEGFQGESLDIAYHDEPLKVAVDLAGYELGKFDFLAHKEQYAAIRERYMPIGGNIKLEIADEYLQAIKQHWVDSVKKSNRWGKTTLLLYQKLGRLARWNTALMPYTALIIDSCLAYKSEEFIEQKNLDEEDVKTLLQLLNFKDG
jgi:hypothetical protein